MAKTTAPLLSFGGSGQIGKTQVYASWRGVNYARRYVQPANPNSTSQQRTRGVFGWLQQVWKQMNPAVQGAWFAFAKGRPFIDRNAWTKANLANLRGTDSVPVTVITAIETSPGVNGGLAMAGFTTGDDAAHHAEAKVTAPDLPDGWDFVQGHLIAFKQQDAHSGVDYESFYQVQADDDTMTVITGTTAGTWVVSGFIEYTKPDGTTAFSPSQSAAQVVA